MNNVRDFGAKGDGTTLDTEAIQKAIDAGGMVYFPPGIYLSGTLFLKSDGGLDLSPGALLLASPDRKDYNADNFCEQNRVFASEQVSGAHFIVAVEQHNITIRGGGRIDGNRRAFYEIPVDRYPLPEEYPPWRPGQMIFLCECENVTLTDLELFDAPYWTCFLHGCEQAVIRGLRIRNNPYTPNGDGIDIDCCRFVTISDCIIDSGDDCITLRGYQEPLKRKKNCEYITITNCILSTKCNAFRIGVGNAAIRFCTISNIIVHHTRHAICFVSVYSSHSQGVQIEEITLSNIVLEAERAFVIKTRNNTLSGLPPGKAIRKIAFSHFRGTVSRGSAIIGSRENRIEKISLEDIRLACTGGEYLDSDSPRREFFPDEFHPAFFFLKHARDITFRNVEIDWQTDHPAWKYGLLAEHSAEIDADDCRLGKPYEM